MKNFYFSSFILFFAITGLFIQPISGLTPARDNTGDWSGTFQIDMPGYCTISSTINMKFQQNGNAITGNYNYKITNTKIHDSDYGIDCKLDFSGYTTGTVSSSSITLNFDSWIMKGSFTSDLMSLSMSDSGINASLKLSRTSSPTSGTGEQKEEHEQTIDAYYDEYKEDAIRSLNDGNFNKAIIYFEKIIGLVPENYFGWYGKGIALLALGKYSQSITNLNEAIERNPTKVDIWKAGGDAYYKLKDCNKAYSYYSKGLDIDPSNSGLKTYQSLAQKCATNLEATKETGNTQCHELHHAEKYEESIVCFQSLIQKDPNNAIAWAGLGKALYEEGEYQEAIVWLEKAFQNNQMKDEVKEELRDLYKHFADEFLFYGEIEKSVLILKRWQHIEPDRIEPIVALGDIYLQNEQKEDAFTAYKEAYEKEPFNTKILRALTEFYLHVEDYQKAKELLEVWKKVVPESEINDSVLIEVYLQNKEYNKVIPYLLEIQNVDPNNDQNALKLAMAYTAIKEYDKALDALGGVYFSELPQTQLGIAAIYFQQNDYENSLLWLKKIWFENNENLDSDTKLKASILIEEIQKKGIGVEQELLDKMYGDTKLVKKLPDWLKNNARWWAENKIDDDSFLNGIKSLIDQGVIRVPDVKHDESEEKTELPEWVKRNAKWWADGIISDKEFRNTIEFLVNKGIIRIG